ncbi:MAG: AMP-dependent synthetase and ligase [Mycobacterium sp.]|jgi:acyl-CoA synthetase (AMP-forming)/AMP-acid ligase II|nr:AMP-dependent synthetase and ligase [Mycobacterium sp.]
MVISSDADITLGDFVTDNARRFPDIPAYRLDDYTLTHGALRDRAAQLVSAMVAAGMRRQDRIAVMGRNSIEFGELLAATQLSGIVIAAVNFRLSPPEVLDALLRVRPSLVFCDDEFAPMIGELAPQVPGVAQLISLGAAHWPEMSTFDDFVAHGSPGELPLVARPEDIACLLFTSGTTGASKCCILGQRELRRVALTMNAEMRCGCDDRGLITMPMFHFGAIAIIAGLHARGASVVLQRQFDPAEAVRLGAANDVTVLHLAPVMLSSLLDEVGDTGALDAVRTVVYSAAPMTMTTLRRALSRLPGAGFLNLYGQTEAIVSGLPRELHVVDSPDGPAVLASAGFPFPGVRARIVNDDGRDVPDGEPGEIVVASDSLFRGYWDDHAATLATLRDGWCYTGDVGRFDERGLLYLVDRKKDVIITGGENVYSPEVEDAISGLDDVAACAVVGAPDERWGEAVCAVVVPRHGATLTLEAVQDVVRLTLAAYKVPRRLVVVDELPVLASGKVNKKRLRAELASGVGMRWSGKR